jgi:hypothetical protein
VSDIHSGAHADGFKAFEFINFRGVVDAIDWFFVNSEIRVWHTVTGKKLRLFSYSRNEKSEVVLRVRMHEDRATNNEGRA